jgi:hypothetical protein
MGFDFRSDSERNEMRDRFRSIYISSGRGTDSYALDRLLPDNPHAWDFATLKIPHEHTDIPFGKSVMLNSFWEGVKYLQVGAESRIVGQLYYSEKDKKNKKRKK